MLIKSLWYCKDNLILNFMMITMNTIAILSKFCCPRSHELNVQTNGKANGFNVAAIDMKFEQFDWFSSN